MEIRKFKSVVFKTMSLKLVLSSTLLIKVQFHFQIKITYVLFQCVFLEG